MQALDVDDMMAGLLVSEGFAKIEELAMVAIDDLTDIEGLDEETAAELQARANDWLEAERKKLDARRKELGVEDALLDLEGLDLKMIVTLGENGVKSMDDLAGCATDDLTGWNERVDGERKHYDGILEAYKISAEDAESLIMRARIAAGWVTEEEIAKAKAEAAERAAAALAAEALAKEALAGERTR